MTFNYWMVVERYPNLKKEVGSSIPNNEISSLLDKNLSCGQLPHVLWRRLVGMLSQRKEEEEKGLTKFHNDHTQNTLRNLIHVNQNLT